MIEDNLPLKALFKASYDEPKKAEERLLKKGFKYDTELSSPESKVFVNEKTNEPVVLFRGTKRLEDWGTNLKSVLLGQEGRRTKEAKEVVKLAKEKYNKPVSAVGTSLGGFLAEQSGAEKVKTFNKAVRPVDILKYIPENQTDYRTNIDVISAPSILQRGSKKKTIQVQPFTDVLTAHSTSAFKPKRIKS